MARLIFSGHKFQGRAYELILPTTTVGRGEHNTLVLHDPSVSHRHCEILVYGDEVIVRDLGSKNGTIVRGERLHHHQRPVHHGDMVVFGEIEARVEFEETSDTDSDTDFTAVHEHVRLLRERQEGKAKTMPDASLELGAAPDDSASDRTLMVSPPPQANVVTELAPAAQSNTRGPSRSWLPWRLVVGVLIGAVALALWWLSGSR
ncbi:MAG: FHA domain-containing protein [Verrucomicrobiales bacterium]|nr:FHA domain-containing protein [Verrucomicrobiales bacterium]